MDVCCGREVVGRVIRAFVVWIGEVDCGMKVLVVVMVLVVWADGTSVDCLSMVLAEALEEAGGCLTCFVDLFLF